ncbi:hypothetical protein [Microtetraspora niveoalba]|uniref:hypothetical protein n=1 Tax=Microtetraspora niveoalba TaxID=46175 RepID=UPI0008311659|nr:hypothetical protein [Microtetraspora niveoalba]
MTVPQSEPEDEPFVPARLREPEPPPESPPLHPRTRRILRSLLVFVALAVAVVVGISLSTKRDYPRGSAQCVDTRSWQPDGTHLVVDHRKCAGDDGEADRRYRWKNSQSSAHRARRILDVIRDIVDVFDGRRR